MKVFFDQLNGSIFQRLTRRRIRLGWLKFRPALIESHTQWVWCSATELLILWHPVNWSLDPLIIDKPSITEPLKHISALWVYRLILSSFFDIDTIIQIQRIVHCNGYIFIEFYWRNFAKLWYLCISQFFFCFLHLTLFWGGLLVLVRRDSKSIGTEGGSWTDPIHWLQQSSRYSLHNSIVDNRNHTLKSLKGLKLSFFIAKTWIRTTLYHYRMYLNSFR